MATDTDPVNQDKITEKNRSNKKDPQYNTNAPQGTLRALFKISNARIHSYICCVLALVLAAGGVASAATVQVNVAPNNDFAFDPADVTIKAGDTVQWTWQGKTRRWVTP
jgi:plastocyanin